MIDHLVYATTDVDKSVAEIADRLGVEPTPGGAHIGLGTRNALIGLGGTTYLEIVGPDFDQPEPAGARPFGIDALVRPRLVAWCARPNGDLDSLATKASAVGWEIGSSMSMARRRPDGTELAWRLTMPAMGPTGVAPLPFLIDWGTSTHPASALDHQVRLIHLRIECRDPESMSARLEAVGESVSVEFIESPTTHLCALVDTRHGPLSFS